jgi:O-antigen ligase
MRYSQKRITGLQLYHQVILIVRENKNIWLKYALITSLLLAAIGLGLLAGNINPLIAVAIACLPLGLLIVEFFLQTQQNWPLYILMVTAFVSFTLPTGSGSRLVISLVLTSIFTVLWLLQMLVQKRFHIYPSPVNLPLLGFCLTVFVSLFWSNLFRDPLVNTTRSFPIVQTASAIVMVMLPSAFLMTANFIKSIKGLKYLVIIMMITGIIGLISNFFYLFLPINIEGLSIMWFVGISVSMFYFDRQLSLPIRALLLAIAFGWVLWGFGLHITWLAGWVPGMMVIGILTWQRSKKLAIAIAIIGLLILILNTDYYLGTVLTEERAESGYSRLAAWEMNWLVTGKHVLFGTGPAGYTAYYMSYFPTQAMATHNNFLDVLSQTGIIGLFFILWFFIALIRVGFNLTMRLKGRGDFLEALGNAAFAGTIGSLFMMAFGDWIFPFAYTQTIAGFKHAVYTWIFMGTLVVIDRLTKSDLPDNA